MRHPWRLWSQCVETLAGRKWHQIARNPEGWGNALRFEGNVQFLESQPNLRMNCNSFRLLGLGRCSWRSSMLLKQSRGSKIEFRKVGVLSGSLRVQLGKLRHSETRTRCSFNSQITCTYLPHRTCSTKQARERQGDMAMICNSIDSMPDKQNSFGALKSLQKEDCTQKQQELFQVQRCRPTCASCCKL